MTDWREAGRKADAHLVRDLYRRAFSSQSKMIARSRTIEALRAAGVTTVLDLWGGGVSAEALVAAGFRVIAVDDGSMELTDNRGRKVSKARKLRALEYAAAEGGYEARFGAAADFAHEADGAYLDFCGPWTSTVRVTVAACRHMKCVIVTLMPDHDTSTDASSMHERQMAYQVFLKMAWSEKPRWESMSAGGNVRRLLDYRRSRGFAAFLYLLAHKRIHIPPLTTSQRAKTWPEMHQRILASHRKHYHSLSPERKRAWSVRTHERARQRYANPELRPVLLERNRHKRHQSEVAPRLNRRLPCKLCVAA